MKVPFEGERHSIPAVFCSIAYTMYHSLEDALGKQCGFTPTQAELVRSKMKTVSYRKDEYLLQAGEVCKILSYITTGSFIQFVETKKDDRITNLFAGNEWVSEQQSFFSQQPSQSYIQAFEDTEVLQLDVYGLHELIAISQVFFKIGTLLQSGFRLQEISNKAEDPEERYRLLLASRPELIRKFPLKIIASFLGMTPETLSRVRKKISHNDV